MTALIPRRKRPTPAYRTLTHVTATPRLAQGQAKALRPVQRIALAGLQAAGLFAIVYHGDDPDVPRPAVLLTYWIGAAVPSLAEPIDMRYPATL